MSAVIKSQNKCISYIKNNNGDEDPLDSGDEKYILKPPNRKNPALECQGQGSANRTEGDG